MNHGEQVCAAVNNKLIKIIKLQELSCFWSFTEIHSRTFRLHPVCTLRLQRREKRHACDYWQLTFS